MEEFSSSIAQGGGGRGMRGWLRGWVEGRSLVRPSLSFAADIQDELMKRADVTAPFILTSSLAILASEQVSQSAPQHFSDMPAGAHRPHFYFAGGHQLPRGSRFHRNANRARGGRTARPPNRCAARAHLRLAPSLSKER